VPHEHGSQERLQSEYGQAGWPRRGVFALGRRMIRVVCCFDTHFQTAFAALALSIDRHASCNVVIHAIHDGPVELADFVARRLKKSKIVFHDGAAIANRFQSAGRQTRVTFVRLFLPDFLAGVSKVLYLDADIVVRRDLAPLFDAGPVQTPVAAALDYPLRFLAEQKQLIYGPDTQWRTDDYIREHVGLKDIDTYFNAGVLLVDLERFSASGVTDRALDFLARKGESSIFNDQDALNFALEGNYEVLDPRWNFIPDFAALASERTVSAELEDVLQACRDDPWIVHFAGLKPWETKDQPGRWELVFWDCLFDLVAPNANVVSSHLNELMRETNWLRDDIGRAQAARTALLRSPSHLARVWRRAVRWKAGLGPAPKQSPATDRG
jgi:lipopolysaccharide biosynthesis glycosyltransferase